MENNNDWFENLNYSSIDQQPQTFVTKHDLELLHKKIIATDLIVQKYQEANRALLKLQIENDDLKKQIEQITNECCIFSKQVTECTQECDQLKEQIEISNSEKRELKQQIQLLNDENTNNYHEIMVLRQYESLKETNDQLSKTVERQQKTIAKLQLQVQRKSPVVYKPNKNSQEPSEAEIALTKSQKSVHELRLALGRLVNFIQTSKIEIPTALHIKPVLKAHDITDDFLEIEGDVVPKPVKKVSKPVISQTDADDEDDDEDHGDFIDINHPNQSAAPPVNTISSSADKIEKIPPTSKANSRKQSKKKETTKTKTRRKKDISISSDNPSVKIDDLADQLEIALAQSDQTQQEQPTTTTQLSSFLSDDDGGEDKISKSDKPSSLVSTYNPITFQTTITHPEIRSSITIARNISFFSDDDHEDTLASKALSSLTPIEPQRPIINEQTNTSLQLDTIIPMEVEITDTPTKYMSFLSEDDDDENKLSPSKTTQEFMSPLELNELPYNNVLSDKPSILPSTEEEVVLNPSNDTISENNQDSLLNKQTEPTSVDSLDPNHAQIVLRLLNVLTQVPEFLKPLRLVRRRIKHKKISQELITSSTETTPDKEQTDIRLTELSEQPQFILENDTINDMSQSVVLIPSEEQLESIEEIQSTINERSENQIFTVTEEAQTPISEPRDDQDLISVEEQLHLSEEIQTPINDISEKQALVFIEEQSKSFEEPQTSINEQLENQDVTLTEEQPKPIEELQTSINEMSENQILKPSEEQPKSMEDIPTLIDEKLKNQAFTPVEEQLIANEESRDDIQNETPDSELHDEPATSTEQNQVDESLPTPSKISMISPSQESKPTIEAIQSTPSLSQTNLKQRLPLPTSVISQQQKPSLKPLQISVISRLLTVLTTLPVRPLVLSVRSPIRKRKRKSVVKKPSIPTHSRPPSARIQTRSLNSIRTCIARCNQPKTNTKKRSTPEITSPSSTSKRLKTTTKSIENSNEYDLIKKFLNSFSKEINDDFKNFLQQKLRDDLSLFNDNFYQILTELLIHKSTIILPFVKQLHPYEESMKILLEYIHQQSSTFQEYFIKKLNQTFEYDIKQPNISNDRIKILNRLFIIACSIFASSSLVIYARLFDIGYYFSHDILIDVLSLISNKYSSLISNDSQTNTSNVLLHRILFDLLQTKQIQITAEYIENLLILYQKSTHDREDLIRSFILISRHQSWSWCANELCLKILFPLLNHMVDQREIILSILQFVLFQYKDNQDFKRDINFHNQIKELLLSLKTLNREESIVRDKIFFILQSCC